MLGETGYVSSISMSLYLTLFKLLEELKSTPIKPPNEVQTNPIENGLSCSVILFSLTLLESALNRTRYIRKDDFQGDSADYLNFLFPDSNVNDDIDETIAVRDAIVHGHLWQSKIYWDMQGQLRFKDRPQLLDTYGNKRFKRVLNPETRQSKQLELNLFPPRVWRRDAYISFITCGNALKLIEDMDRNCFYFTHIPFLFEGKTKRYDEVINNLEIPDNQ